MAKRLLFIALFGLLLVLACILGQAAAQEATDDTQVTKDGKGVKEPEPKAKEQVKAVPKLPAEEKPAKVPVKEINLPKGVAKDTESSKTSNNVGKGKAKGKGKILKSPPTPPKGKAKGFIASDNSTVPIPTNPAAPVNTTIVPANSNSTEPIVPNAKSPKNPKAKAKATEVSDVIGKTVQPPAPVEKQIEPSQPQYQPPTPPAPPAEFPSPNASPAPFTDNAQPPPPNADPASESPDTVTKTVKIVKEPNTQA